ncbi:MAG: hypothetical protein AAGB29_01865 [Planctomycetota bacterium]
MTSGTSVTASESKLASLCESTFLRFWSYPNPYRDQRDSPNAATGKEVCDLLVHFDNNVVIFSDKSCSFPANDNIELAWSRWHKRAILKSAKQAIGAERWIKNFPDRVFLNPECTQPLPAEIVVDEQTRFFLIVVAGGARQACIDFFGEGIGSLMTYSEQTAGTSEGYFQPFFVNAFPVNRRNIHTLDEVALEIVLNEFDTASDFIGYLKDKEEFCGSVSFFTCAGEEEIVAHSIPRGSWRALVDEARSSGVDGVQLGSGFYEDLVKSKAYKKMRQSMRIGYLWDSLIEDVSGCVLEGTLDAGKQFSLAEHNRVLTALASESRAARAHLAHAYSGIMLRNASAGWVHLRIAVSPSNEHLIYAFVGLSPEKVKFIPDDEFRHSRRGYLLAYVHVAASRFPDANFVVGIASETGSPAQGRSHDFCILDVRENRAGIHERGRDYIQKLELTGELDPRSHSTQGLRSLLSSMRGLPQRPDERAKRRRRRKKERRRR